MGELPFPIAGEVGVHSGMVLHPYLVPRFKFVSLLSIDKSGFHGNFA
jgi:hypothetical protein